jgi:hypothetical protein
MRAINHYSLDGDDRSIVSTGHMVLDLGIARQLNHTVELNFGAEDAPNKLAAPNTYLQEATMVRDKSLSWDLRLAFGVLT